VKRHPKEADRKIESQKDKPRDWIFTRRDAYGNKENKAEMSCSEDERKPVPRPLHRLRASNGLRVSCERSEAERVRCTRVLGGGIH
jgi:hypothetical protein